MAKILIAGCGDIGLRLANSLIKLGHKVTGLRRNPPASDEVHPDLVFYPADLTNPKSLHKLDQDFDYVFYILTPGQRDPESYRNIYVDGLKNLQKHFSNQKPHWFFISSTSVYAQDQGQWIDEDSPTHPTSETAKCILQGEEQVLTDNSQNIIVRFSGIYGPGRERLLKKAIQTTEIQDSPPAYTNRIHQEDCVRVLVFLLRKKLSDVKLESCYLASDDEPVALSEVIFWMREQMGYSTPNIINSTESTAKNKRCSNARLKALGFNFKFPTYKDGYLEMIKAIQE